jgi:hypothetical protein
MMPGRARVAYRSPAGRVVAFDDCGQPTERHEPGPAADAAWERLRAVVEVIYEEARWLDAGDL